MARTDKPASQTVPQLPEDKVRAGAITATTWKNRKNVNGKDVDFTTVKIERSYKDKDGNWQTTNSFRVTDLPKVMLVAHKAFEKCVLTGVQTEEDDE